MNKQLVLNERIYDMVLRARSNGTFRLIRDKYSPAVGDILIYETLEHAAKVVKKPDSVGNFLVRDIYTNQKAVENIKSGGISGFITSI